MADEPARGPHPDGVREGQSPLANSFLTQKRYPGDAIAAGPPPAAPAPQPPTSRIFTRIVLPLVIFIVAIGVIAWIVQYLPSRQKAGGDLPGSGDAGDVALNPLLEPDPPVPSWHPQGRAYVATWGVNQPGGDPKGKEVDANQFSYHPEYEVFTNGKWDAGYYDFTLRNVSSGAVEFGLLEMGCRCSKVKTCVLATADEWERYRKIHGSGDPVKRTANEPADNFTWKGMAKEDRSGVTVPLKGWAVVRLYWDGHKQEPERVQLVAKLWANPVDKPRARQPGAALQAVVAYVRPVRFELDRLDVGVLSPQGSSNKHAVLCWSPTRELQVRLDEKNADPRFEFSVSKPLSVKECCDEEKRLSNRGIVTRIRSAYRIGVKVHETKGGIKPLDLGSFQRAVPLAITGNGEALTVPAPSVRGVVRSPDIRIADGQGDQDRINLKNFKARFGTNEKVMLWAKPGLELEYVGFSPNVFELKVSLAKAKNQGEREWAVWEMHVEVPGGVLPGPMPEDFVIILRVRGGQDRQMRIPVIGTAGAY